MSRLNTGDKFNSSIGILRILRFLGKGKSGYSYLAEHTGSTVVLKLMHDEPNPYYEFAGNKVEAEVKSYTNLVEAGIKVPKLISKNPDENYLVKDYVSGTIASKLIAEGKITSPIIKKLFNYSSRAKLAGLNIDYFPTNFVLDPTGELFYIDYETNSYSDEWSLENWGIYYWANSEGFTKFLYTNEARFINSDLEKGIPIKEEFEELIQKWIADFSH